MTLNKVATVVSEDGHAAAQRRPACDEPDRSPPVPRPRVTHHLFVRSHDSLGLWGPVLDIPLTVDRTGPARGRGRRHAQPDQRADLGDRQLRLPAGLRAGHRPRPRWRPPGQRWSRPRASSPPPRPTRRRVPASGCSPSTGATTAPASRSTGSIPLSAVQGQGRRHLPGLRPRPRTRPATGDPVRHAAGGRQDRAEPRHAVAQPEPDQRCAAAHLVGHRGQRHVVPGRRVLDRGHRPRGRQGRPARRSASPTAWPSWSRAAGRHARSGPRTFNLRVQDMAGNWSNAVSTSVHVPSRTPIFADSFDSGDLSSWSSQTNAGSRHHGRHGRGRDPPRRRPTWARGHRYRHALRAGQSPPRSPAYHARFSFAPNTFTSGTLPRPSRCSTPGQRTGQERLRGAVPQDAGRSQAPAPVVLDHAAARRHRRLAEPARRGARAPASTGRPAPPPAPSPARWGSRSTGHPRTP